MQTEKVIAWSKSVHEAAAASKRPWLVPQE